MTEMEDKFQFKCQYCPAAFTEGEHLRLHLERHRDRLKCQCKICGMWFTDLTLLHLHQKTHEQTVFYYCDICHAQFTDKEKFTLHEQVHKVKEEFSCNHCLQSFKTGKLLKLHQLYCREKHKLIYDCDICRKQFDSVKAINNHMMMHPEINGFKCSMCQRNFSNKKDLAIHEKTHENLNSQLTQKQSHGMAIDLTVNESNRRKSYCCRYCGKEFRYRRAIIRHSYRDPCPGRLEYVKSCDRGNMPIVLSSESSDDDMDTDSDTSETDFHDPFETTSSSSTCASQGDKTDDSIISINSDGVNAPCNKNTDKVVPHGRIVYRHSQVSGKSEAKISGQNVLLGNTISEHYNETMDTKPKCQSARRRPVAFMQFGRLENQEEANMTKLSHDGNSCNKRLFASSASKKSQNEVHLEIWNNGASRCQIKDGGPSGSANEIVSDFNDSGRSNELIGSLNDSGRFNQLAGNGFNLPKLSNYAGTDNLLNYPSPQHMTLLELDSSDLSEENFNEGVKLSRQRQVSGNSLDSHGNRRVSGKKTVVYGPNCGKNQNDEMSLESRNEFTSTACKRQRTECLGKTVEKYPKIYTAVAVDELSMGYVTRDRVSIASSSPLQGEKSSEHSLKQSMDVHGTSTRSKYQKPIVYKKQLSLINKKPSGKKSNRDGIFVKAGDNVSFYVEKQYASAFSTADECSSAPSDFDDQTTISHASFADSCDKCSTPSSPESYMADNSTQGLEEGSVGISSSCTENLPESGSMASQTLTSVDSAPADSTVNECDMSQFSIEIGHDSDGSDSLGSYQSDEEGSLTDHCSSLDSDDDGGSKVHSESCRKKKLAWVMRHFKLKLGTKNGKPCITEAKSRKRSLPSMKPSQESHPFQERISCIIENVKQKYSCKRHKPLKLHTTSGSEVSVTKSPPSWGHRSCQSKTENKLFNHYETFYDESQRRTNINDTEELQYQREDNSSRRPDTKQSNVLQENDPEDPVDNEETAFLSEGEVTPDKENQEIVIFYNESSPREKQNQISKDNCSSSVDDFDLEVDGHLKSPSAMQELSVMIPTRSNYCLPSTSEQKHLDTCTSEQSSHSNISPLSSPLQSDGSVISSLNCSIQSKASWSSLYIQSPVYKTRYALKQIAQKKMKKAAEFARNRKYGPTCVSPKYSKSPPYKTRLSTKKGQLVQRRKDQTSRSSTRSKTIDKFYKESKPRVGIGRARKKSPSKIKSNPQSQKTGVQKQLEIKKRNLKNSKTTGNQNAQNGKKRKCSKENRIKGGNITVQASSKSGLHQENKETPEMIEMALHTPAEMTETGSHKIKHTGIMRGIDLNCMIDELDIVESIDLDFGDADYLPRISAPRDDRSRRYKWRQIRKNYISLRVKPETENQNADGTVNVIDVENLEKEREADENDKCSSGHPLEVKQEEKSDNEVRDNSVSDSKSKSVSKKLQNTAHSPSKSLVRTNNGSEKSAGTQNACSKIQVYNISQKRKGLTQRKSNGISSNKISPGKTSVNSKTSSETSVQTRGNNCNFIKGNNNTTLKKEVNSKVTTSGNEVKKRPMKVKSQRQFSNASLLGGKLSKKSVVKLTKIDDQIKKLQTKLLPYIKN